jgi:hypothetical protein
MDGPLILHMVLFFTVPLFWGYRRFFETVGPESAELIELCRTGPLLAAVRVRAGDVAAVSRALAKRLGRRSELKLSLGNWPWTHHVVKVGLAERDSVISIRAISCRAERTKEAPVVGLTNWLREVTSSLPIESEIWLCEAAYGDVTSQVQAPAGWRVVREGDQPFPYEPYSLRPSWTELGKDLTPASLPIGQLG